MRRPWSQIKLIALVMLLTVIAHDAVMAGDPHALPNQSRQSHHRILQHQIDLAGQETGAGDGIAMRTGHDGASLVSHAASPCGLIAAVRPPLASDLLADPIETDAALPASAYAAVMLAPERTGEPAPGHPPGVRRALLQVFLN